MRPKKKTRKKMGHRQELTRVMVKSITLGKSSLSLLLKKILLKRKLNQNLKKQKIKQF